MAITHKARKNAAARPMAVVLNEVVCDLRDPIKCRTQLAFAGFSDAEIDRHLANAQHIARRFRRREIDHRAPKQWD